MKIKATIYSVVAAVSAFSMLAALFPSVPAQASVPQATVKVFQQRITMATTATASNVSLTTTVSCNGSNNETRLDILLNSGCDQMVIAAITNLPHLTVINSESSNKIFVQTLPPPPQVRWINAGKEVLAFQTITVSINFKPTIYTFSSRNFAPTQTIVGRNPETKTLAELQVQRC